MSKKVAIFLGLPSAAISAGQRDGARSASS